MSQSFTAGQVALLAGLATLSVIEAQTHALSHATGLIISGIEAQIQRGISTQYQTSTVAVALDEEDVKARAEALAKQRWHESLIFLHGTSSTAWPALSNSPADVFIDPTAGGGQFGVGFYTFKASDPTGVASAMRWARQRATEEYSIPIVGVFGIPLAEYEKLTKLYVPGGGSPTLSGFGLTGYDVVYGPLSGGLGQFYADQYKFEGVGAALLSAGFLGAFPIAK